MFNKKAQSQIITTVLIILLVLAAIVIVWQVVQGTVQQGADEIGGQSDCFTVGLEISSVTASSTPSCSNPAHLDQVSCEGGGATWNLNEGSVTVKRTPGGGDLRAITILSDGSVAVDSFDASALQELETVTINGGANILPGREVQVAAIVGETNKLCGVADSANA